MSRAEGFAAIPNWMIRDRNVSRRAVLVYASLASRSGLGGIFPSQSTIAEESGVSERTARTALGELEKLGVIERVRRADESGHRMPDGYVLLVNGLAATLAGRTALPAIPTGNEPQATPSIEVEPIEVDARKRATRIPEPFIVTAEMRAWAAAEAPGIDVDEHTREFVDYWRGKAGRDASKADWTATWRNWLRKAYRWGKPAENSTAEYAPEDSWMAFNR